jgi:hypothetical protein
VIIGVSTPDDPRWSVPAVPSWLPEPTSVEFAAPLPPKPAFHPDHPLGCHRRRILDRVAEAGAGGRVGVGAGLTEQAQGELGQLGGGQPGTLRVGGCAPPDAALACARGDAASRSNRWSAMVLMRRCR